jgi:hypothetical protein
VLFLVWKSNISVSRSRDESREAVVSHWIYLGLLPLYLFDFLTPKDGMTETAARAYDWCILPIARGVSVYSSDFRLISARREHAGNT